ncbi:hypothetical protein [Vagococcus fluvialis]|uniref:hypothetical protein n=1 Tax=Vagococcus fluvialis TaxID=2738 RepID=UPI001A8F0690|nr:hypothetical protein [Vagococcus fluvialis]MBO0442097.1 hypothetical protein [Vagococcus fluvialis]
MDLKNRLQEQYVNYRDMMKEKDLVEDVRQTIPFMNEVKKAKLTKENTRKWHSKLH